MPPQPVTSGDWNRLRRLDCDEREKVNSLVKNHIGTSQRRFDPSKTADYLSVSETISGVCSCVHSRQR